MKTLLSILLVVTGFTYKAEAAPQVKAKVPLIRKAPKATAGKEPAKAKNADLFQTYLLQQTTNHKLSPELRLWTEQVAAGEFEKAANSWTTLHIPESFAAVAKAAQLYTYWKMNLTHTFVSEWVEALNKSSFSQSQASGVLEKIVNPELGDLLLEHAPIMSANNEATLARLSLEGHPAIATLKAWTALRDPRKAENILSRLSLENPLRPFLAETVALEASHKNDSRPAVLVLNQQMQPYIDSRKDLAWLARKDLFLARLAFKDGDMENARKLYMKIPNTSRSYLNAREELAWTLLRLNDTSRVRGEVRALTSPLFDDHFQPESFVVRAVSNIQLCYFDKVEKDIADFENVGGAWAKRIDQATNAAQPPTPPDGGDYVLMSARANQSIGQELARVRALVEHSPAAKKNWQDVIKDLQSSTGEAKRREIAENKREWRNLRTQMAEAIRKMRFVKIEYMSEMRELARGLETGPKLASAPVDQAVLVASNDQIVFPVDDDLWPDELFKMRSNAQAKCLSRRKIK